MTYLLIKDKNHCDIYTYLIMASSMSDTMDYFFGPVSSQYCIWFYAISVFGFINLILVLIGFIVSLFTKKVHFAVPLTFFLALFTWFFMYFQNRLLYNMCLKSETH